jgi:hypothetical protein
VLKSLKDKRTASCLSTKSTRWCWLVRLLAARWMRQFAETSLSSVAGTMGADTFTEYRGIFERRGLVAALSEDVVEPTVQETIDHPQGGAEVALKSAPWCQICQWPPCKQPLNSA